jgi:MoaA/NifB/PqqE/SkfB family radical SAM enzyme
MKTHATAKALELVVKQLTLWTKDGTAKLASADGRVPIKDLHLELTHRCDLKCIMCHHWEMPSRDPGSVRREMSAEDIEKFVSESRLLADVESAVLTGGEAFLRADAPRILALLGRLLPKASVGVLANLWNTELLRRRLDETRRLGARGIWIGSSLDGVGEVHDRIRGQPGAFAGFLKSLEMLRSDFPETRLTINFTITPKNQASLWETYQFAKREGLGFGCQFVVDHEGLAAPETFVWAEDDLASAEEQIDRVLLDIVASESALERMLMRPAGESRWLWSRILFWWYLRKHGRGSPRFFDDCMAGRRYAMLDPEGDLFFCPVNKHKKVGNVRERPFDEVWNSARAEEVRSSLIPCQCRCWLNCIANPVLDRVLGAALCP